MKSFVILGLVSLMFLACEKRRSLAPAGTLPKNKDLELSKTRAIRVNEEQRQYIQEWIAVSGESFYPTPLNYWTSNPVMIHSTPLPDGEVMSYEYVLEDFSGNIIYPEPIKKLQVSLGKYKELAAVEDAVRRMKPGEQTTLLVPSSLAYGSYGDEKKIPHDFPLIIRIKLYHHER